MRENIWYIVFFSLGIVAVIFSIFWELRYRKMRKQESQRK